MNAKLLRFLVTVELEHEDGKPAARGELERLIADAMQEAVGVGIPFLAGPAETSVYNVLAVEVERIEERKAKWLAGEV